MSVSISDEIETCIDLEERWHIPSTTEVHDRRRSEVCLLDAPSSSSTERASISEATIATADDDPLFENREAPYQPKLKIYPGTQFGNKLRRFKSSWYSGYKMAGIQ